MLRIITGTAKNRRLKAPNIPNFRAVQEIAKGSVFSIISSKIVGANCLDLFAGSGNLGLEALSRGANFCDFVDENFNSAQVISDNIEHLQFSDKSEVFHKDAVKYVANTDKNYDIIFVDPFYEDISHKFLLKNLDEILKKDGLICFFHGENFKIEESLGDTNLKIIDERKFGKSLFTIIRKSS